MKVILAAFLQFVFVIFFDERIFANMLVILTIGILRLTRVIVGTFTLQYYKPYFFTLKFII